MLSILYYNNHLLFSLSFNVKFYSFVFTHHVLVSCFFVFLFLFFVFFFCFWRVDNLFTVLSIYKDWNEFLDTQELLIISLINKYYIIYLTRNSLSIHTHTNLQRAFPSRGWICNLDLHHILNSSVIAISTRTHGTSSFSNRTLWVTINPIPLKKWYS